MQPLRKLPIGIQDFEKLRTEGYLYVDKTDYVYNMVQTSTPYILCRPRRFGKSLLASTLRAYFEGKKELFAGLKIAELETEWKRYPVFHIALNVGIYSDARSVLSRLHSRLDDLDKQFNVSTSSQTDPAERLRMLILGVSEKAGEKVVVIIDEYDKPLIDTMQRLSVNEEVRALMQGFYGVLKEADSHLRFVFLTGVTRFGQTNVFSGLNQLKNLTLRADYAGICGITQEELESYFQPEIEAMANKASISVEEVMAQMKQKYDGYHFANVSPDVYNPFSVLNALDARRLGNYWFETGKTTFLVKVISESGVNVEKYNKDIYINESAILNYQVGKEDITPLLYQSGYLTIKDFKDGLYCLGYPNDEVKYGFIENLVAEYAPEIAVNVGDFHGSRFANDIRNGDVDAFMERLADAISLVPYEIHLPSEAYYHTICYLMFAQMGAFSVQAEIPTARGRSDMEVITNDTVYIFEFKTNRNGGVEAALAQIDAKGYAKPYQSSGKPIIKIGVEFDLEQRALTQWKMA